MSGTELVRTDTGEVVVLEQAVQLGTLRATNPVELLAAATAIATPLGKR